MTPPLILTLSAVAVALLFAAWIAYEVRRAPNEESDYEFGRCNDRLARRHKETGEVQFILWKVGDRQGEHVYEENYWTAFHPFWWPSFKPGQYSPETTGAPPRPPLAPSESMRRRSPAPQSLLPQTAPRPLPVLTFRR
jgi:hypothetical protein